MQKKTKLKSVHNAFKTDQNGSKLESSLIMTIDLRGAERWEFSKIKNISETKIAA